MEVVFGILMRVFSYLTKKKQRSQKKNTAIGDSGIKTLVAGSSARCPTADERTLPPPPFFFSWFLLSRWFPRASLLRGRRQ